MILPPGGTLSQRIRLYSGIILFTYAALHFINHSLGLISVEAMSVFQEWRETVTRSVPGGLILTAAIIVHPSLALAKIALRSTLKITPWEAIQILFGLSIPVLLIPHFVNTRIAYHLLGREDDYLNVLGVLWPEKSWQQILLLLLVWFHGCIGVHFWLRITPWYRKVMPYLLIIATLIPALGIAGFTVAGRTVAAQAAAGAGIGQPYGDTALNNTGKESAARATSDHDVRLPAQPEQALFLKELETWLLFGFYGLLGVSLSLFALGYTRRQMSRKIAITYIGGPTVRTPPGPTLLEISRMHGIPHASVCGGRARCSTCRVHVSEGHDSLPPPGPTEAATLQRVKAAHDMRLACQIRPQKPLSFTLVVRPSRSSTLQSFLSGASEGIERDLVVLFFDVRGFTRLSAERLPYDIVFLLNQLFEAVGSVIIAEGGWIDKYLGDGLMAVFGRNCDITSACYQALSAARAIDLALDEVNESWQNETGESLRIGMGIHAGPLVIGRIGAEKSASLTVIGRVVNTAARLEDLTKEKNCQLILSATVADITGLDTTGFTHENTPIRGLPDPLDIVIIPRARDLPHQGNS